MRFVAIVFVLGTTFCLRPSFGETLAIPSRESGPAIAQPPLPWVNVSAGSARGPQLIRISLPCAPGALLAGQGVVAQLPEGPVAADVRVITEYPGAPHCARRAMITVPFNSTTNDLTPVRFVSGEPVACESHLRLTKEPARARIEFPDFSVEVGADALVYRRESREIQLRPAGLSSASEAARIEVVEDGQYYVWLRLHTTATEGPRILDVRVDSLGTIAASVQIQRAEKGDGFTPAFGWTVSGATFEAPTDVNQRDMVSTDHFAQVSMPTLAFYGRGERVIDDGGALTYWRCTAEEKVPFQEAAWRSAEIVLGKPGHVPRTSLLEPYTFRTIAPGAYTAVYGGERTRLDAWPVLEDLLNFTMDAIKKSSAVGDDAWNVTSFNPGNEHGGSFGMNRLNHASAMYFINWTNFGHELRDTATRWCLNMYDLSIWWGDNERHGGTRYNNAVAAGQKEHEGDTSFMWRTNDASTFCTKGFDSFLYAYEETGDPRFKEALEAQVAYAKKHVHVNTGEARNIGDVKDFMVLYRATGQQEYLDEAMRLFRELREVLSTGDLFSQNCKPLVADPPFIDDDAFGYEYPFAKPYIIGYALAGLPDLLRVAPEEPKLRDVVRAVADFLAETVDPSGGWRYPHPRSSGVIISQGMEHAQQICNAAAVLEERGENIDTLLDAVETVLQARVMGYMRTGAILAGLNGWERSTGALPEGKTLHDLYKKPGDRDASRDYTEGSVGVGGSPPEGLVYFDTVLRFYLAHRPAERLFHANAQLQQMLDRVTASPPPCVAEQEALKAAALPHGMKAGRPSFADAQIARMDFPLAFAKSGLSFADWREKARGVYLESLQAAPPRVAFNPEVLATEDRGSYEARKLRLNLSGDYRVTAYLLVPKAAGPHPAVLALHDHGAHFSIGKEKVVKPFGVEEAVMQDAQEWVGKNYGGRWFGDALAARGYVVFSTDALFWGERGRAEGVDYAAQETLAANLYQLGRSLAGTIVWDDIRSAEFVQSLPEVDPARIGAMGLSMGAHRTWNLAAATDIVSAGAAICWMGTTAGLMAEGNNQTRGQSAHTMIFPGLRNALDYPNVASIACPKPMLYFNGEQDALFPVADVGRAYEEIRAVYDSQGKGDELVTKLWPVPHEFNAAMQEEAFAWMDKELGQR